jgi:hypothetical protein
MFSNSGKGLKLFPSIKTSRRALVFIKPRSKRICGCSFLTVKRPRLLPKLRTRGAIPLLPLHALMPWTGKTLLFILRIIIYPNYPSGFSGNT